MRPQLLNNEDMTSSGSVWMPGSSNVIKGLVIVGGLLSSPSTSSASQSYFEEASYLHAANSTTSGLDSLTQIESQETREAEDTQRAISELRRISGLTWEQLAELFGVSRRSVHYWASGEQLNAPNEQHLLGVLSVVRWADRGSARHTRAALNSPHHGTTPLELLASRRFEEAREALGKGEGQPSKKQGELSAEAKAARKPLPPLELFDARHERIHSEPGRARAAKTVRNKRREDT